MHKLFPVLFALKSNSFGTPAAKYTRDNYEENRKVRKLFFSAKIYPVMKIHNAEILFLSWVKIHLNPHSESVCARWWSMMTISSSFRGELLKNFLPTEKIFPFKIKHKNPQQCLEVVEERTLKRIFKWKLFLLLLNIISDFFLRIKKLWNAMKSSFYPSWY